MEIQVRYTKPIQNPIINQITISQKELSLLLKLEEADGENEVEIG